MQGMPHCCWIWRLRPATVMWTQDENRTIRPRTNPPMAWVRPSRSRPSRSKPGRSRPGQGRSNFDDSGEACGWAPSPGGPEPVGDAGDRGRACHGSDSAAPSSAQLPQPPPHQLCLGLSFSQVGLALGHHLRRRLPREVGIGEAAGQAGDLLFNFGQIFLQPLAQGIEALLGHGDAHLGVAIDNSQQLTGRGLGLPVQRRSTHQAGDLLLVGDHKILTRSG